MNLMRWSWTFLLVLVWASSSAARADDPSVMLLLEPLQPQTEGPHAGTHWKSVSSGSARFLAFQHVYRIAFQEKTRRFLGGSFFKDYGSSVKGLGGWRDGDSLYTNYLLHPMQGAASGFIFIQANTPGEEAEFGKAGYWRSRLKAFGFAAIYGAQFELGPFSEASIGNVGKTRGTMGFVDLVVTPIGGFGWILAEDAIDHFVVRKLERKWKRKGLIRFVRVALNPARSFANVMRLRLPWYRPGRELDKLFPEEPTREGRPLQFPPVNEQWDADGTNLFEATNIVLFVPA